MTNGDGSVFTFDLNESLWFKKGQEVDEIMGISLEPEISIQEFDDYVSVRGVIELKGEYFQIKQDDLGEEQVLSLRDHPSQRFIDRVESYEDGVNEFFHNFPVEVSIPKYRIESLDDVLVGIESFDYELPEYSQLKLNATVAIHGVKEDAPSATLAKDREEIEAYEDEQIEVPPEAPVDETFEFDVKEKQEEESVNRDNLDNNEENTQESEAAYEPEPEPEPEPEAIVDPEPTTSKSEKNRLKNKKSQTLSEFFGHGADKEEIDEKTEKVTELYESSESESESSIVSFNANKKDDHEDSLESSSMENKRDANYLLSMFADKEEESRFSSLKMCIVQESDTLDSIAERYEISSLTISKTNRLNNDQVSEGQILYIPTKQKN
ncbi:stage VI sporulation protein D [Aquibacillus rhizosphaerae]|uniref:Stage VI sporulation protein D n=1 Tax=Aquibacillus rhizosphaerae TaxID=3051431 RepID=A0ABT7L768_9BACI|nr:stage VI sporulation protein D [Aquibacillus sp. LR5S19]MDL4841689.1 stage VI sporulation protein D [Aquibacillus sp. LR5S19]